MLLFDLEKKNHFEFFESQRMTLSSHVGFPVGIEQQWFTWKIKGTPHISKQGQDVLNFKQTSSLQFWSLVLQAKSLTASCQLEGTTDF